MFYWRMPDLYHCFYKEPKGESILASCFRRVNGEEKNYLFAATHLSKSLAFAFSYHDNEVALNGGIAGTDREYVVLTGGQETLEKDRRIRVFAFPDDGFTEIPNARQAVSEQPLPFSRARLVMDTTDINDLMKNGLQVFVLPEPMEAYLKEPGGGETFIPERYFRTADSSGEALGNVMRDLGARWINRERGLDPCPELAKDIAPRPAISRTAPTLAR